MCLQFDLDPSSLLVLSKIESMNEIVGPFLPIGHNESHKLFQVKILLKCRGLGKLGTDHGYEHPPESCPLCVVSAVLLGP